MQFSGALSPPQLDRPVYRRHLIMAVCVLLLLIWGATWSYLFQRHTQMIERAQTNAQNLARVLALNISATLQTMDIALQATADEVARQRKSGSLRADTILPYMERMLTRVPGPDGFRVVAANGDVLFATGPHLRGQNLADRAYFQQLQAEPGAGLVISRPLFGRIRETWAINVARRVNRADGSFDGIVYAPLDLVKVSQGFSKLDLGPNGIVALRNAQRETVARYPYLDSTGQPMFARVVNTPELLAALQSGQAQAAFRAFAALDGVDRIYGLIRIPGRDDYNLSVGLAVTDFMGEWHAERRVAIMGALLSSLLAVISALLLMRAWQRRAQSLQALRHEQARLRAFASVAADWFWEFDPQCRFVWFSSGMAKRSGIDPAALLGQTCMALAHAPSAEEEERLKSTLSLHQPLKDWRLQLTDSKGEARIISLDGKPLFDPAGKLLGYIGCGNDITAKVHLEGHFRKLAHYDTLTQLPNRALFHDRVAQALLAAERSGKRVGLLFVDLDRFKPINDSCGHAAGDAALMAAAERMRAAVRASDTVGRIGSDEFLVLLPEVDVAAAAVQVADKIVTAFTAPVSFENHMLDISVSIGIAVYPEHGDTAETLIANADAAMYLAKQAGGGRARIFRAA